MTCYGLLPNQHTEQDEKVYDICRHLTYATGCGPTNTLTSMLEGPTAICWSGLWAV